jgi:hypothetical protein
MGTASWAEASLCPKCKTQGREVKVIDIPYRLGAKGHVLTCPNKERCNWGEEGIRWIVQVNPNGSIPVYEAGPKNYPALPKLSDEAVERQLQEIENAPLRGGEIKNPWAP